MDVIVAAALLILLAPLIAAIAGGIKIDSRGSVFYRCRRVGFGGRDLWMLKFRKMRVDAVGTPLTLVDDERFTRMGRLLAKTKLDELPQLWNVLKGEMSLVGPRPEHPSFVARHSVEYERILSVKPGVTGLCQLAFAKEGEILDGDDRLKHYVERLLPQKVRLDELYAARRSFGMDLRILLWTAVAVMLRSDVAVHRTTGRLTARRRPLVHAIATAVAEELPGGAPALDRDLGRALRPVPAPKPDTAKAVVLAGGRGTRLAPYTSVLPKPLMPIGDHSILEIVVDQLDTHGFTDITFSVGYLSHLIRAVFDHRNNGHANIRYVVEDEPLGTAGPLRLVEGLDETFVVMNGDVLTTLDYRELVRHHCESGNLLTVAARKRMVKMDYGVLYVDGDGSTGRVSAFEEKPEIAATVSMGVYVFEPRALAYVPAATRFDFPDLVQALLAAGEPVGTLEYGGVWFDIGRHDDYEQAAAMWSGNRAPEPQLMAGR